jgi:hypothetical protein
MKWYKKILFWEIHRIPLNIIICLMIFFGFNLFSSLSPIPGDNVYFNDYDFSHAYRNP